MNQSQSKTPLTRKQPDPIILVLDAALINSVDTDLAAILAEIAQKNVKIVFVGDSAEQLKEHFPNITIETISLVNLKRNLNKYSRGITHCFMSSAVMTIQVSTSLKSQGFECNSIQLGDNLSEELQLFSEKKLPKTKAPVQRSTSLVQKQQVLGSIYGEQPISNNSNEKLTTPKLELPPFILSQPQTPIITQTNNPIPTQPIQSELPTTSPVITTSSRQLPTAPTRNIPKPSIEQQQQILPPPITNSSALNFSTPTQQDAQSEKQQNEEKRQNKFPSSRIITFDRPKTFSDKPEDNTESLPPFQSNEIIDNPLPPIIHYPTDHSSTVIPSIQQSLDVPEQQQQGVVPEIYNNSQQSQIITPVPQIPVPQQFPLIQNFSYSLCDALGKPKDKEENLPKITLNDEGCLAIKIKLSLTDGVNLTKDPFWGKSSENEFVDDLVVETWATTYFTNVGQLINNTPGLRKDMPKDCGFQFCGDYKLSLKCLKGDQSMTPEKLSGILLEKKTSAPAIIQYCGASSSFIFGKDQMSFYLYVQTSNGTPHLIKLANKNDRLTKLELESSGISTMMVSHDKYSIIHDEIESAAIEALYRELCVKEGLDFDDVWNKAKYPQIHDFRSKLYNELVSGTEIDEEKNSLPELGLDADGTLHIKVSKNLAQAILKNQKLGDIFKSDKDGNFCAQFKNITSLKTALLDVLEIDIEDVELEGLYRELCEITGHDFITVWGNVKSTASLIKPAIKNSSYNPGLFGSNPNMTTVKKEQTTSTVTNNPLPVKAIIIEEDMTKETDSNPYYEKVMVLIKEAVEKNVPVIIYCLNENNETERFQWAKKLGLPVTTAYQAGLKTNLSDLQLNPDNCLHLSMGQSKLYVHTKRKTNYFVIQSSDDFDLFLKQDYKLPINLEKVYPEIHGFIFNLDFKIMNQVITNETKSNAATNLPALSLDAQGCLSIKQGDSIIKYQNVDEFSSMLKSFEFECRQGYPLTVRLVQGEEEHFTIDKVSKLTNLKLPALIPCLCTENDKQYFYYCELSDGQLQMRQLANTANQLGKLNFENSLLSISNKDVVFHEIAAVKNLSCINIPTLYQELCHKEGLNFNKVWSKVQHYPEIYYICNLLSSKLLGNVEESQQTYKSPVTLCFVENALCVVVDKALSEKIKSDEYLSKNFAELYFDGNLCLGTHLQTTNDVKNFLSYFEINVDDDYVEKLLKALCQREGLNFDQVWKHASKENCTVQ